MTIEDKAEEHVLELHQAPNTPFWKHILWAVVAGAFLWAAAQIPNTLIVFSMAWLISYLLNPAIDTLEGRKLGPIQKCSRGMAVGIVAGLLIGFVVAAGAMMLPHLTEQVQKLINLQDTISDPMELPATIQEKAEPFLARLPEQYRDQAMDRAKTLIQDSASTIGIWVSKGIGWIGSFLGQLLSGIFLVCTAFLVSLYMLMNWHGMGEAVLEKLPRQYRDEVRSLSTKMNVIFGGYLKATILTSIACMIATFLSLLILSAVTGHDFPYKGLVAFVAGIAYPVPVIGIIATSILGGVLGFLPESNLGFGLAVLVTINVVNVIIDRTIQPKLMSDAIGVSELFVMFAAFAGGEVAGIWGMLLGIPVAAMGKALFEWFHLNFLMVDEHGHILPNAADETTEPGVLPEPSEPSTLVEVDPLPNAHPASEIAHPATPLVIAPVDESVAEVEPVVVVEPGPEAEPQASAESVAEASPIPESEPTSQSQAVPEVKAAPKSKKSKRKKS